MSARFPPVVVPDSQLRFLKSEILGDEYKISVALPPSYANSGEVYSVLYVLDADLVFCTVTETVRHMAARRKAFNIDVPDMIVVGIGHPMDPEKPIEYYGRWRTRDFTPTKDSRDPSSPAGGADNFLAFVRDELKPLVNTDYRTKPEDNTILGISYGGLFALYTLFNRPDTFNRYIALSPSIWWDNKVTLEHERKYASQNTKLPARLFLSAGSLEKTMIQNLQELTQILQQRSYKDLEWSYSPYEDETHLTAAAAALRRAILYVFSPPKKE